VVEIENAILIAAGDGPSCAVVEGDPELHCWGYNAHGEVGTGTTTPFQYDTPQVVMGSFTDVRDLSAGGYADLGDPGTAHAGHVCVVLGDGGAHCWGRNDQGQLGNDRQDEQSSTPQEVLGTVHALGEIAAGGHHTCAITADGADLYCWGDNEYGQCATTPDEPEDDIDQAARAIVVSTTVGTTLEQVTTGRNHTCVRSRGRVWCWGSNSQGQLGMGAPGGSSHAPTEVVVPDE
jgi:alpha-tubulin suppressor-like RCC1 family protein